MATNDTGTQNSPGTICPHCEKPRSEWDDNGWLPEHIRNQCPANDPQQTLDDSASGQ